MDAGSEEDKTLNNNSRNQCGKKSKPSNMIVLDVCYIVQRLCENEVSSSAHGRKEE